MAYALLSVGLLVFLLGVNVSRKRHSVTVTQDEAEADPTSALRKAIRAHGNCIEYIPMLSLMILTLGLRLPLLPWWIAAFMLAAVTSRYVRAIGILTGGSVYEVNGLKSIGAFGAYLTGTVLSVILIIRAAALF